MLHHPSCARASLAGFVACVVLLMAGCGTESPLPQAGINGGLYLRQWDIDPRLPTSVSGDSVSASADLRTLAMRNVRVRAPLFRGTTHSGWLLLTAPSGRMRSATTQRTLDLDLDGPIACSGHLNGLPFVGKAEHVRMLPGGDLLFSNVIVVDVINPDQRHTMVTSTLTTPGHTVMHRDRSMEPLHGGLQRDDGGPADLVAQARALPLGYVPPDPAATR